MMVVGTRGSFRPKCADAALNPLIPRSISFLNGSELADASGNLAWGKASREGPKPPDPQYEIRCSRLYPERSSGLIEIAKFLYGHPHRPVNEIFLVAPLHRLDRWVEW